MGVLVEGEEEESSEGIEIGRDDIYEVDEMSMISLSVEAVEREGKSKISGIS